MTGKATLLKRFGAPVVAAATTAVLVCSALFAGWFLAFIVMDTMGTALLVGMNYLAWPIVFPLLVFPVVFLVLLGIMPLFSMPFPDILTYPNFWLIALLPMTGLALAVMLATCPLDIGGTLLSRGAEAFG